MQREQSSVCLSILAWFALHVTSSYSTVDIQTTTGVVRGNVISSLGFQEFHGIPFAQPPVGPLRWRPSLPAKPWAGVLDATTVDPDQECPQQDIFQGGFRGKEDCLVLSVYTPPQCTTLQPCPVMQWIHGGAWIIGGNDYLDHYNGTILASKGVVVVAANYRLDALGWLALTEQGEETGSANNYGNYGLYDQNLALKWTAANIRAFGGDPKQVTIFGASAGGFSVCQHLVMTMSNGLFNKAIMQSGGCEGPYAVGTHRSNKRFGNLYARMIGCPTDGTGNFTARMECLRALPVSEVLVPYIEWNCKTVAPHTSPWCIDYDAGDLGTLPPFAPVVGWFASIYTDVLDRDPLKLLQSGVVNRGPNGEAIRVIFGTNEDEMALFINQLPLTIPQIDSPLPVSDRSFTELVQYILPYNPNWNQSNALELTEQVYPQNPLIQEAYRMTQFGTDLVFRCATRRAARLLDALGVEVYLYNFNFHFDGYQDPNSPGCQSANESKCGVFHSTEVPYVFSKNVPDKLNDQKMATYLTDYWTGFAIYGAPRCEPTWPRYTAKSLPVFQHMEFSPTGDPKPTYAQRLAECDALDVLDKA